MLNKIMVALALMSPFSIASAATEDFPGMPAGTRYVECIAGASCTESSLRSKAIAQVKADRQDGAFTFLLGNLPANTITAIRVSYLPPDYEYPGHPGFVRTTSVTVPAGLRGEFTRYHLIAKAGMTVVNIPPSVAPVFDADVAVQIDISVFLRGQPFAQNLFAANGRFVVLVRFSNGFTAKYVYVCGTCSLSFEYIPGSLKDANGRPVNDQVSMGNITGYVTEFAGNGSSVIGTRPLVQFDFNFVPSNFGTTWSCGGNKCTLTLMSPN